MIVSNHWAVGNLSILECVKQSRHCALNLMLFQPFSEIQKLQKHLLSHTSGLSCKNIYKFAYRHIKIQIRFLIYQRASLLSYLFLRNLAITLFFWSIVLFQSMQLTPDNVTTREISHWPSMNINLIQLILDYLSRISVL